MTATSAAPVTTAHFNEQYQTYLKHLKEHC